MKLADRGETDLARVRPESRHGLPGLWLERATAEDLPALAALEAECHTHPWNQSQFQEEASLGPPNALLVLRAAASSPEAGWTMWARMGSPPCASKTSPSNRGGNATHGLSACCRCQFDNRVHCC